MKTLRSHVFETNSSSMHSITIHKRQEDISFIDFTICKDDELYGRGSDETLMTPYEKAQYWWTTIVLNYNFRHPDSFRKISLNNNVWDIPPLATFNDVKRIASGYLEGKCSFEDPMRIYNDLGDDERFFDRGISIDHESNDWCEWSGRLLLDKDKFLDYLFGDGKVYLVSDCYDFDDETQDDIEKTSPMVFNKYDNGKSVDENDRERLEELRGIQEKLHQIAMKYPSLPEPSELEKMQDFVEVQTNKLVKSLDKLGDKVCAIDDIGEDITEIKETQKEIATYFASMSKSLSTIADCLSKMRLY